MVAASSRGCGVWQHQAYAAEMMDKWTWHEILPDICADERERCVRVVHGSLFLDPTRPAGPPDPWTTLRCVKTVMRGNSPKAIYPVFGLNNKSVSAIRGLEVCKHDVCLSALGPYICIFVYVRLKERINECNWKNRAGVWISEMKNKRSIPLPNVCDVMTMMTWRHVMTWRHHADSKTIYFELYMGNITTETTARPLAHQSMNWDRETSIVS